YIDSAATSTEEIGNEIYPPMRKALMEHDVPIGNHRARQVKRKEYDEFDLIIAMDDENLYYLRRILGDDTENKIHYLVEYTDTPNAEIEDPWYTRNFEKAYQDIFKGCKGLLDQIS
nr:low molecular weight phosphotyrosine protein phosphatase [Lachnospiraceae bacterium]